MWDVYGQQKNEKKKSTAGKSNRVVKPDAMIHRGGSRSFGQQLKKNDIYTFDI